MPLRSGPEPPSHYPVALGPLNPQFNLWVSSSLASRQEAGQWGELQRWHKLLTQSHWRVLWGGQPWSQNTAGQRTQGSPGQYQGWVAEWPQRSRP